MSCPWTSVVGVSVAVGVRGKTRPTELMEAEWVVLKRREVKVDRVVQLLHSFIQNQRDDSDTDLRKNAEGLLASIESEAAPVVVKDYAVLLEELRVRALQKEAVKQKPGKDPGAKTAADSIHANATSEEGPTSEKPTPVQKSSGSKGKQVRNGTQSTAKTPPKSRAKAAKTVDLTTGNSHQNSAAAKDEERRQEDPVEEPSKDDTQKVNLKRKAPSKPSEKNADKDKDIKPTPKRARKDSKNASNTSADGSNVTTSNTGAVDEIGVQNKVLRPDQAAETAPEASPEPVSTPISKKPKVSRKKRGPPLSSTPAAKASAGEPSTEPMATVETERTPTKLSVSEAGAAKTPKKSTTPKGRKTPKKAKAAAETKPLPEPLTESKAKPEKATAKAVKRRRASQ